MQGAKYLLTNWFHLWLDTYLPRPTYSIRSRLHSGKCSEFVANPRYFFRSDSFCRVHQGTRIRYKIITVSQIKCIPNIQDGGQHRGHHRFVKYVPKILDLFMLVSHTYRNKHPASVKDRIRNNAQFNITP